MAYTPTTTFAPGQASFSSNLNGEFNAVSSASSSVESDVAVVKEAPLNLNDRRFGGASDGSTSDDAAWTAALAALPPYTGGAGSGEIYVPGLSVVTAPVVIPATGLTISGPGNRRAAGVKGNFAGPVLRTDTTGNVMTSYIALKNLFVFNLSTDPLSRAIEFYLSNVVDLVGSSFQSAGKYVARLNQCYNVTGDRTQFDAASSAVDICLFLDGSQTGTTGPGNTLTRLRSCDFRNAKSAICATTISLLDIEGGCHFEQIAGGLVESVYQGVLTGSAWQGGSIRGNYFESCNTAQFLLFSNINFNRGLVIGGNFITNPGNAFAIFASNCTHCEFEPNYIYPGANAPNVGGVTNNASSGPNIYHPQFLRSGTGAPLSLDTDTGVQLDNSRVQGRNSSVMLTKAGAPTDADFTVTPPNGTLAVDVTNSRIYARIGGLWKSVAVA